MWDPHDGRCVGHLYEEGHTDRVSSIAVLPNGDIVTGSFAEVADRADLLAAALKRLGVGLGDRVGTFMWNGRRRRLLRTRRDSRL